MFSQLIDKYMQVSRDKRQAIAQVELEIESELQSLFNDSPELQLAITRMATSKDFTWNELGEIDNWVRFSWRDIMPVEFENNVGLFSNALDNYLSEHHCMRLDSTNDCILQSVGPALIINEEGDVFDQDSGKEVIQRNEYEDKYELYELIEKYMEKTGVFPWIFSCDRYGNIYSVNTQEVRT